MTREERLALAKEIEDKKKILEAELKLGRVEANKEINAKLVEVNNLIKQCEDLATEYKLDFSVYVGDYVSGYYNATDEGYSKGWSSSNC